LYDPLSGKEKFQMFIAKIQVMLRPAILDVQGKAVQHALHSLGYGTVEHVRMGKFITLSIGAATEEEARKIADDACQNLLSNPIIEDYALTLERAGGSE
jgi:phosphoribosylformylglycinamidine synthase PurS subunit